MKTNPKEVLGGGLVGLIVEVVAANNSTLKGLRGKIVDETKNTLTIDTGKIEKKIIKEAVELKIIFKGQSLIIKGDLLVGRPEERLKKKIK